MHNNFEQVMHTMELEMQKTINGRRIVTEKNGLLPVTSSAYIN